MDQSQIIQAQKEEIDELRREVAMLRKRSLQDLLERAVRDQQLSEDFSSKLSMYYEKPLSPWYVCIAFFGVRPTLANKPEKAPSETIPELFEKTLEPFGQPFFFDTSDCIGCLLNTNLDATADTVMDAGREYCASLQKALLETYQEAGNAELSHIAISYVSDLQYGPRDLYRSAMSVSERRTKGESPVLAESTPAEPLSQSSIGHLLSLEPLFWNQIKSHSFFDAATTMDQLIEITSGTQHALDRTLASVFSKMEIVLYAFSEEKPIAPGPRTDFSQSLLALSQAKTFQEMREKSFDILAMLEDAYCTPPDTRNKKMPAIEAYINEQFHDPLLCVASVADRFRLSPSYLSRIFKADKGIGMLEYIHNLRLQSVKDMLIRTDLSIDEIAQQSGFTNRWSLNRVFKRSEGVTPGIYREQHLPGASV